MAGTRDTAEPTDGAGPQTGIATSEPRSRAGRSPAPAPARPRGGLPSTLPGTGAATAAPPSSPALPAAVPSASTAAAASLAGGSDIAMLAGAAGPLAMAAMSTLNSIAGHFGEGVPTAETGRSTAPPTLADTGAPTGPIAWDSGAGAQYSAVRQSNSAESGALGEVNTELRRILGTTVEDTMAGRAAMAAIIAETDAALTALGKVGTGAAAQSQVVAALDAALQRAGSVLRGGQAQSAISAEQINALAARYIRDSGGGRPARVYRAAGASGGPPGTRPAGAVGQWIDQAMQILRQNGYDTSRIDPADIATIIAHESAGNPHAINNWDSNAAAGTPSKGLMQTIDPTFDAYALPGHRDIWNPVDNIIAGVRYAIHRYGSVDRVPGIVGMHRGTGYVGY